MAKTKKNRKQPKPISIIALVLCSSIVLYFVYSFIKVNREINELKKGAQTLVKTFTNGVNYFLNLFK